MGDINVGDVVVVITKEPSAYYLLVGHVVEQSDEVHSWVELRVSPASISGSRGSNGDQIIKTPILNSDLRRISL